jgi:hypothetical protein
LEAFYFNEPWHGVLLPPPDVHAFKDYLTTSEMWLVLSILPPTYGMGNEK